jgi:hypothetical protein
VKELSQLSRVYYLTRVINKKKRRTAGLDYYPTQVKPPLEPQLLLVDKLPPLSEPPSKAKTKIFFLVFWLWQAGQVGYRLLRRREIICLNLIDQSNVASAGLLVPSQSI